MLPHNDTSPILTMDANAAVTTGNQTKTASELVEIDLQLRLMVDHASNANSLVEVLKGLMNRRSKVLAMLEVRRGRNGEIEFGKCDVKEHGTPDASIVHQLKEYWQIASSRRDPEFKLLKGQQRRYAVSIRFSVENVVGVLYVIDLPTSSDVSNEVAISKLIAAHLSRWMDRHERGTAERRMHTEAMIVKVLGQIDRQDSLQSASDVVASELKRTLNCHRIAVGLKHQAALCRVSSISDVSHVEASSPETQQWEAVLNESILRGEVSAWPPLPNRGTQQLLAHRQLARRDECMMSVPLKSSEEECIGAIAMSGPREMVAVPEVAEFLDRISKPIGNAIESARRTEPSRLLRSLRLLLDRRRCPKNLLLIALWVCLVGILFLPMPYKVSCQCQLEPSERRYCVAPQHGILEKSFVQSGQKISAGDELASLDGRELLWKLSSVQAELCRAEKKLDLHRSRHEVSDTIISELEVKKLENDAKLLSHRIRSRRLFSPEGGIVLVDHVNDRRRFPVEKGDILFEIGPISPLRVDLMIPVDEIHHVRERQHVEIAVNGVGNKNAIAAIAKIRPRSETRNNRNVFVAECIIDNQAEELRPGMKGHGKITTDRRSIGWILFHRLFNKIAVSLPW